MIDKVRTSATLKRTYMAPAVAEMGSIAELTQTDWKNKTWGSGDSFIMNIDINPAIANIVDSITHLS